MADNGKYYWLKLKRDFFKRHDVRIIEQMPNGKDYILFYLKMLLESIDHEGELRFSETIPYNEQMLSVITDTNVDIVKAAMQLFMELGMVEVLSDSTIYMREVQKLIGSETKWAKYKRKTSPKTPELENFQSQSKTIPIEIEKEKELELEKELEIEGEGEKKGDPLRILTLFNEICISYSNIEYLSSATQKQIEALLDKFSLDDFQMLFEKAEQSDFLKGENQRKWQATFEWLVTEDNMCKVLNGNYDNKAKESSSADFELDVIGEWLKKPKPKTAGEDESIATRAAELKAQFRKAGTF